MYIEDNQSELPKFNKIPSEIEYIANNENINAWWSGNGVPTEGYARTDIPKE